MWVSKSKLKIQTLFTIVSLALFVSNLPCSRPTLSVACATVEPFSYPNQCCEISEEIKIKLVNETSKNDRLNSITSSFLRILKDYPWKELQSAVISNDTNLLLSLSETLIVTLTPYLTMEPKVPINELCKPPPLRPLDSISTCSRLNYSRKVGVLFQFGFDVDVLEIHLNELNDLVDRFFILESTRCYYRGMKKTLIWERVKDQPRFQKFKGKIVHLIVDDAGLAWEKRRMDTEMLEGHHGSDYGIENLQERLRWEKFLEWNNATQYFQEDDLLGFGDVDEIPNREAISYLKNCEMPTDPIDFGIWFPFGSIDQAFEPDHITYGHPFAYADPTYWTLRAANNRSYMSFRTYPTRNRGRSTAFFMGGIHMSHSGYLPYQLVKRITIIERNLKTMGLVANFYDEMVRAGDIFELELMYGKVHEDCLDRVTKIKDLNNEEKAELEEVYYLPWFYNCNRKRYPSWERGHDTRLD